MASRPSWNGFIKFNLISVPVQAYNAAASGGGKIGFHLLHARCNSRIRYQKVCPLHGVVSNDEIVSGYEVAKGQYVIVDADERNGLRAEDDKAIAVDTFVRPEAIDPIYFSGRTYYLVPDGKVAQKPYAVLREAMRQNQRYAVAQVVFAGRNQVGVVRPFAKLLAMSLLHFESEVKKPSELEEQLDEPSISEQEEKLAETLLEAATAEEFELSRYRDEYTGQLSKLIQGKARKKTRAAPSTKGEEPAVINLMDALRESLARTQKAGKPRFGKNSRKVPSGPHKPSRRKTG